MPSPQVFLECGLWIDGDTECQVIAGLSGFEGVVSGAQGRKADDPCQLYIGVIVLPYLFESVNDGNDGFGPVPELCWVDVGVDPEGKRVVQGKIPQWSKAKIRCECTTGCLSNEANGFVVLKEGVGFLEPKPDGTRFAVLVFEDPCFRSFFDLPEIVICG